MNPLSVRSRHATAQGWSRSSLAHKDVTTSKTQPRLAISFSLRPAANMLACAIQAVSLRISVRDSCLGLTTTTCCPNGESTHEAAISCRYLRGPPRGFSQSESMSARPTRRRLPCSHRHCQVGEYQCRSLVPSAPPVIAGNGDESVTTPADWRSQRNRTNGRGGQLLTRVLSLSNRRPAAHLPAPGIRRRST
jgi:hypothetical protein